MRDVFDSLTKLLKQANPGEATVQNYKAYLENQLEQMGWTRKRHFLDRFRSWRLFSNTDGSIVVHYGYYRAIDYTYDWNDTIHFERGLPVFFLMSMRRWITIAGHYEPEGQLHIWFKEHQDMWL